MNPRRRSPNPTRPRRGPIIPEVAASGQVALNEELVRERDRDRGRELARLLALGVAVLLPLLFHVWQQVALVESAYRAEELRAERDRLDHLLQEVRMERSALESLDRIEAKARERLGLIDPPTSSVVSVLPPTTAPANDASMQARARPQVDPEEGNSL